MAIQSSIYATDGTTRTYPSTKHIATKQHCSVWKLRVSDSVWEISNVSEYSLVNNSVIFVDAVLTSLYSEVEIRVADTADELLDSPTDIAIVASSIADINTVATDIADITNVADNIGAVSTVSGSVANVNTVASSIINVNNVGGSIVNVNAVALNAANINVVASDLLEPVSEIDTVATSIANVNTVGSAIANVNTVATNITNVNSVATTIVPNIAEILLADDNAIIATEQAVIATSMATVCTNIYDQFDDKYLGAKATPPLLDNDGNALTYGALYFDTTQNYMKVWSNAGWINAGSSVNGTTERYTYHATAGQTVFTATYEAGYIDVFLNGSKLENGVDFTAVTATNITLTSPAALNDVVDIICYAVFELSTAPTKDVVAYTVSTVDDLVSIPSSYTTAIVKDLDSGGTFIWSSTGTANGGTVFAGATGYWTRQYSGAVNIKWFGAKGDGVVDDTVALSNAFSWLSASNYRKLIGNTNDSYLCKQTLPITSSAGIFDGNGCIFYHAVTSNNPLFIFNNTSQSPFELRNFTVFGSGTVGNVISIFGALSGSPSFLTIDNVKVNSVIGTGKNSTGTSVPSCFVWCENSMTIRITNCTIYNSSGGIYFTNTQKILISNTTIDTILTGRHLYLNGCRHIVINGRSIINGGTNSGQCEFIGNTSLSVTETRFKSGNGYAISATGQNNSLTISRCNFEVYECTSSSVLVTTSASGVNLYSNYFTLINSGASTIFTQAVIDIIDESGGGYISLSGKIESNKIIVNNGLTLNAGIRLNSSLNSLRGWSVNNNIIGNVATSSIITNGILLLGTQQSTEVLNNGFNHQGSGSYVVTGLSIGSSCSGTKVSGLSSSGITNSLIVDSGIHTIREQLGVWEAGTFTPVIYGGTVEGTGTYTMQNGKYSKIGNLVFINIALTITAHTGSGEFRIRGLPFPSFSLSSQLQSMNIVTSGVTFSNQIVCYPSQGTSFIRLSQLVTNSAMTNVQLSTSCTVYITGVYEIA